MSLTLPAGEISVLLGPSGTGKSVFLKTLVGLLRPDRGSIWIDGPGPARGCPSAELYEVRRLFGVLFQDGALFGSMNIYDNVAFPLREHTRKSGGARSGRIVTEKLEMVGLAGAEDEAARRDLRRDAQAGRAWPARSCWTRRSCCSTSPTPGLDPVRTAYLNQLIIDLNQQTDATFLIVTHDINTARTVPDNIGLIYHGHLAMFGPREMLLSSTEPVVRQFLNAQRVGPIGMAEEKDADELEAEAAAGRRTAAAAADPAAAAAVRRPAPRRAERPPGQWCADNGVIAAAGLVPRTAPPDRSWPAVARRWPSARAPVDRRPDVRPATSSPSAWTRCAAWPAGRCRCASSSSRRGSSARCRSCRPRWCRSRSARSSRCSSARWCASSARSRSPARRRCWPWSARPARSSPR